MSARRELLLCTCLAPLLHTRRGIARDFEHATPHHAAPRRATSNPATAPLCPGKRRSAPTSSFLSTSSRRTTSPERDCMRVYASHTDGWHDRCALTWRRRSSKRCTPSSTEVPMRRYAPSLHNTCEPPPRQHPLATTQHPLATAPAPARHRPGAGRPHSGCRPSRARRPSRAASRTHGALASLILVQGLAAVRWLCDWRLLGQGPRRDA